MLNAKLRAVLDRLAAGDDVTEVDLNTGELLPEERSRISTCMALQIVFRYRVCDIQPWPKGTGFVESGA